MSFDTKNVALLGPQIFPLPFLFLLAFKKHTNLTLKGQLHTINFPIFLVSLLVFFSHERSNNIGLPHPLFSSPLLFFFLFYSQPLFSAIKLSFEFTIQHTMVGLSSSTSMVLTRHPHLRYDNLCMHDKN